MKPSYRAHRGFTLIELMIVVAIVAILAAIAYPSYRDSILKGRRAQARTALMELLQQQERYMTQNNCYLGFTNDSNSKSPVATAPSPSTDCGGVTASSVPFKNFAGDSLNNATYLLTAAACPAGAGSGTQRISECVQAIATPVQPDPQAGALRMTSTGSRDCTGTASATNPKLCWP